MSYKAVEDISAHLARLLKNAGLTGMVSFFSKVDRIRMLQYIEQAFYDIQGHTYTVKSPNIVIDLSQLERDELNRTLATRAPIPSETLVAVIGLGGPYAFQMKYGDFADCGDDLWEPYGSDAYVLDLNGEFLLSFNHEDFVTYVNANEIHSLIPCLTIQPLATGSQGS